MNLRILYHGLGMAGKTTNLEKLKEIYTNYVYDRIHQCTPEGRTVYLDMLSLSIKTKDGDAELNVSLFTTPGQERFKLLRSWLFSHVNGVVFVFDTTRSLEENLKAYHELIDFGLSQVPTVVQANKMDVEGAMPIGSIVDAFPNIKVIEAVAIKGIGVVETFKEILKEVVNARATSR